ncbi:MAG: DNA-binding response regulator [Cytophagaceae bacterium]|nr:DNA-binding response regulator [Cytophagaceae bacterium]|tara:strand:- start:3080 stop:3823 length:744 start_codon:yes stop_codon:yes gene_type:complete
MKIRTILVDDEPKAIAILQNKLERFCPVIEVVATTQSPHEAISLIQEQQPELVFLDIAMPELNGLEVLRRFESPDFEVIFATAFDDYAIEAIKHCAIGYLVKPVDNEDLVMAVNNAIKNIEEKTALRKNLKLIENLGVQNFKNKTVIIPSVEGLEFIKIEDIVHCEGVDGYTKVYLRDDKPILSSNSIGHFNRILENQNFYLIHKSHLINLDYIDKYLNEGYVVMGNEKLPVSRNRRSAFLEMMRGN